MAFFILATTIWLIFMFNSFNMPKKAKVKPSVLPSDFQELDTYIFRNRQQLMEQVVSAIEFALEKNLPVVEVFGFKNSDFVVALSRNEFRDNINHIYTSYIQNEWYELCPRIKKVELLLDNQSTH
jgi:hypothetical protein